ncbi:MAG: tryptophan synthase subunit alpha [Candidatus Omnitrophica bacterium]|nr:tryptophan synthase subunit alpha [Candidatus Omnitrophota bacterium]
MKNHSQCCAVLNPIDEHFETLRAKNEKALVLFIEGGDPSMEVTRQTLRFCQEAGVDVVELGIPFSDPLADGPVIQDASFRAIEHGTTFVKLMTMLREERGRGLKIPVVVMSSYNPLHAAGLERSAKLMFDARVDGIIIPDLPHDEDTSVREVYEAFGILPILMTTPTTEPKRHAEVLKASRGFIYYVSLIGLTGLIKRTDYPFKAHVIASQKRAASPVCVGFGISTPDDARAVSRFADGVIIGSALVRHLKEHSAKSLSPASKKLIRDLVSAVKSK